MFNKAKILCVEKTPVLARRVARILGDSDVMIVSEQLGSRMLRRFENEAFDILVFSSTTLEKDEEALELLEIVATEVPSTRIMFMGRSREIKQAMSTLPAGCCQFCKLPMDDEELELLLRNTMEQRQEVTQSTLLKDREKHPGFEDLVGRSEPMLEVFRQIRLAAASDIPVLLHGETGTGKDVAAQAIHSLSDRADKPYLPVHLGALPRELVSSELFGHEKGAFTGATAQRPGTFEQADGGTVFLDEVPSIDERTQISLLRLIETKTFNRIGGQQPINADVRIIAATNESLSDSVKRGAFRQDLYYRLDVFRITMPPLSERHGDIPLLIDYFLRELKKTFKKNIRGISTQAMALMEEYRWPGNVRELRNVIQRAVVTCEQDILLPEHLPERIRSEKKRAKRTVPLKVGMTLAEMEREMLMRTLMYTGKNRKKAAELLGISRRALYNKMARYDIHLGE
ncbi:MAG: sigma-54 interaction domain-containing protein [Desulfatibacillaceae bacterium]